LLHFVENEGVLIVADGAGGLPGGAQASALTVSTMEAELASAAAAGASLREAILNGFEVANRKVRELGMGAATTLVVVELSGGGQLRTYHAGDSAVLLTGQRGKLKLLTMSHSPVGYAVEAGLLDQEAALHHEDLHVVSNLVGMPDMRIEMGSAQKLSPRDTVVVGSDGLFDNLHTQEIVDLIRVGPIERSASKLQEAAARRMTEPTSGQPSKPDDLSFIVYRLRPPAAKASTD
jgi:serine/threonine protein phosphatase PrpC